jgi:hypothetical protein
MVGDAETAGPDVPRYQAVEQWPKNLPARVGAAAFGMLVELPYLFRVIALRAPVRWHDVPGGLRRLVRTMRGWPYVATRWGLDHFVGGVPLEDLIRQDFAWQEGWEYRLG